MSFLNRLKKRPLGPSGFGFLATAEQVTEGVDLTGKVVFITGVNSGLGQETMRVLSKRGAHIIGAARTLDKATEACAAVDGPTTPVACELSDLSSVAACASTVRQSGQSIDVLVCNAGIMALPELQQKDGVELQFMTNHLGHFLLVNKLLDSLAPGARVVILSSGAHFAAPEKGIEFDNLSGERDYEGLKFYGQSKLANILFAKELTRRYGDRLTANALHPGIILTNLGRHMKGVLMMVMSLRLVTEFKSVEQGAATTCYLAANPGAEGVSGKYYDNSNEAEPLPHANDAAMASKLWEVSEQLVAGH
ncbi:MAG: SDR family oxidoreductase [Alphaproteobacteria bacterium]|nr:MAG: SDR family oxidoreductase [Alphaproteobacteria bacterium]